MTDPDEGEVDALFRQCCALLQARDPRAGALLPRLERHVGYAPGWRALAATLLESGQVEAGVVAAERAVTADAGEPESARLLAAALLRLGLLRRQQGNIVAAEVALARALSLDPEQARAAFALGLIRQDRRDHEGAAAAYRAALAARPKFYEAALNLGIALQEARQFEAAMAAYAQCYRLNEASFGRIAQAVAAAPVGRLWLDLERFRADLVARA